MVFVFAHGGNGDQAGGDRRRRAVAGHGRQRCGKPTGTHRQTAAHTPGPEKKCLIHIRGDVRFRQGHSDEYKQRDGSQQQHPHIIEHSGNNGHEPGRSPHNQGGNGSDGTQRESQRHPEHDADNQRSEHSDGQQQFNTHILPP